MTRPEDEGVEALDGMLEQGSSGAYDPYEDPWAEPAAGGFPSRAPDATAIRAPVASVDAAPVHRPEDYATDPGLAGQPVYAPQPGYAVQHPVPGAPRQVEPRRGGPAPWVIGLALGSLLLLAGLAIGFSLLGGRGVADADGPTVVTETTTTEVTTDSGGTQGSASPSSSSPPSSRRTRTLPAGATACGSSTAGGLKAAIGSDVTSCEFAVNVRDAYVDAGGRGNRSIRAFSPKTGRTYTMTCRGEPVTCTGGNNAVVHLY